MICALYNSVLMIAFSCRSIVGQGLPSYWSENTFTNLNGTMADPIPMKVFSFGNVFNEFNSSEDKNLIKTIQQNAGNKLPEDQYNPSRGKPDNKSGTVYQMKLGDGYITNLVVIDEFNFDGNGKVPVQISTIWKKIINNVTFIPGDITAAINSGNLLNITLHLSWTKFSEQLTNEINKNRYWYIDEYLCYYQGSIAKLVDRKCAIPYTELIEHYYNLWVPMEGMIPRLVNGNRTRVTNNQNLVKNPPCFDNQDYGNPSFDKLVKDAEKHNQLNKSYPIEVPTCKVFENVQLISDEEIFLPQSSEWYMYSGESAGIGWSYNTTFGYNSNTMLYALNFTVLFNNWTFDFPRGLLDAYRDGSFTYAKLYLDINFWLEDEVKKDDSDQPPAEYFFMMITMCAIGFILILAVVFRFATGTGRAFNLEVWSYYNKMRKMKKIESSEEEILEQMKISAMEEAGLRQLQILTGSLNDIMLKKI